MMTTLSLSLSEDRVPSILEIFGSFYCFSKDLSQNTHPLLSSSFFSGHYSINHFSSSILTTKTGSNPVE